MKSIVLTFGLLVCILITAVSQPLYEFRAVWVATVVNIDWPSEKGLSTEQQKKEFIDLLEMHHRNGMNALIVQVRPAADAFYPSDLEPWSEYLTGKQGQAPSPYYDPLQFMIIETHKRGMEFHAWLNPYRAVFSTLSSSVTANHITKQHPEWFVTYNNQKIFNPGLPEVRDFVSKVVKDIVRRYDVDGIHMDDYFYPYPDKNNRDFPDTKAFEKYGNGLKRGDWRRANCDSIISQLYETIRSVNPNVKFGISPFGVWRNQSKDPVGSPTRAGVTNYDDLYADILLWLQKGWIDYVAPQLYWNIGHPLCDYDTLLKWWNEHVYGRHLYIGHAIERAGTTAAWRNKHELPNQIQNLREYETTQGSIYFNSKMFNRNPNGWSDSLRLNYYQYPALPPPMPWIDSVLPEKPVLQEKSEGTYKLVYKGKKRLKGFLLFIADANDKDYENTAIPIQLVLAGQPTNIDASKWITDGKRVFASTVDWNNNISDWIELQ